ncbi:MAG: homoserine kinase [Acetobacter sp.]|nr:homoserine kinase [Acetobacter sp.]
MAVYTNISDEELRVFLESFDLGTLVSFRGIAEGVENSNFYICTSKGKYILTLYEKRVKVQELPWFLGFMRYLASQGVTCPQPIPDRQGRTLKKLAHRPAAITTFLTGIWPRVVKLENCRPLGRSLAQLHLAGWNYPQERANSFGVEAWSSLLVSCAHGADRVQSGIFQELSDALSRIQTFWPKQEQGLRKERGQKNTSFYLPRGQIHADLFPDNVFFHNYEVSGIIDFYFACTDFLAYDIAICLNAWCFSAEGIFNRVFSRHILQGYEEIRPLEPAERHMMPLFAQGAALRFLLTRLYDWIHAPTWGMVTLKDPLEYLIRLRFHQRVEGMCDYGL